ncbi:uncharacterized protein LOC143460415 [Clavelina lepadiformis]|uniref:uncharacterized protein LOC143460415 n=1 Tax=Clavelina lepadiformis TaxID=159417 RepID=UPI0040432924
MSSRGKNQHGVFSLRASFQQDQCDETLRRHEQIELTLSPAYDRQQTASSLPDIHSKNNPLVLSQSKDNQLLLSDTDKVKSEEQLFDTAQHSRNCCHGIIEKWKELSGLKKFLIIGWPLVLLGLVSLSVYLIPLLQRPDTSECPVLTLKNDLKMECSNGDKIGSICTFTCTGDKKVLGEGNISCNESSLWSSAAPNCCLSWKSLMDSLNVLPYTNFHVKYGDANVKCYTKISFINLELNYNCNCKDVSTERSQTCHFRRSSSGSCEHALSFLVRDMNKIDPARYPSPCDPENIKKECDRSLT